MFIVARVWDWQLRILHWLNAILIIALLLLGSAMEWAEESPFEGGVKGLHITLGYLFIVTLSLRILWGFAGNEFARWQDLIPATRDRWKKIWENLKWYLTGLRGKPPLSIGHNPLASLFYILLFLILISQVTTGLILSKGKGLISAKWGYTSSMAYADEDEEWGEKEWYGEGEEGNEWAEEVHEFGYYFILFFLLAHLTGLVAHEIREGSGLFSSMIHGKKYIPVNIEKE